MIVAALYVETDGTYFGLDGVEPWDELLRLAMLAHNALNSSDAKRSAGMKG